MGFSDAFVSIVKLPSLKLENIWVFCCLSGDISNSLKFSFAVFGKGDKSIAAFSCVSNERLATVMFESSLDPPSDKSSTAMPDSNFNNSSSDEFSSESSKLAKMSPL